jgi:thiamine-monophosphate kinase
MKARSLKSLGEFGLIDLIRKWTPKHRNVLRGIGDDAAVLRSTRGRTQLLSIDTIVEDVDFRKRDATPQQIGWKALAVNLSDIAAMGGIPTAAVVSLTMPRNTPLRFVKGFFDGIKRLSDRFGVALVGGDLSRGSKISSSVAILGEVPRNQATLRSGARVGDVICVTGRFGGSILGRHLTFAPRIAEGRFLATSGVTSMIDVSDGLMQDLGHLVSSSKLAFQMDATKIPVTSAAKRLARGNRARALEHALYDGEDFELLFTISSKRFARVEQHWKKRFQTPLTAIGRIVRRKGSPSVRSGQGYQHF